jgi:hypothetical protein
MAEILAQVQEQMYANASPAALTYEAWVQPGKKTLVARCGLEWWRNNRARQHAAWLEDRAHDPQRLCKTSWFCRCTQVLKKRKPSSKATQAY